MGSGQWLLAVIGAVASQPPQSAPTRLPMPARRDEIERRLRESGLAYGTGAHDPAVELSPDAAPAERAFAHFVAGLVRLCQLAATLANASFFVPGAESPQEGVRARRAQLLAVLAASSGNAKGANELFEGPLLDDADVLLSKLAERTAARLSRRYLAVKGPFAGLPLHNGLCAIEVRACATLALAAFEHDRLGGAAATIAERSALAWRCTLVELLAGLAHAQEHGKATVRGSEQVLRSQRLPVREARILRRALAAPRPVDMIGRGLRTAALRRFALEQVLLAALVDRNFEPAEVAYVERLADSIGATAAEVARIESEVEEFYRRNMEALQALRLADQPEGLPHALTTRLEAAVLDNLDRMLEEIRKTGELAELLARATAGQTLTAEEKGRVRAQLIDLAKTIPALAIFAAPGGLLLLPILLKLLPFNLLPSSFVDPPTAPALPDTRRKSTG